MLCISLYDVTSFLVASYSKCKCCLNQVLWFPKIILIKDIGMDGWMDGWIVWMDGWVGGWMDELDRQTDRQIDAEIEGWMD